MKIFKNKIWTIGLCLFLLVGCEEPFSEPTHIQLGDKHFILPAGFIYQGFDEERQVLQFYVDIYDFSSRRPNKTKEDRDRKDYFHIEIRPLYREEDTISYQWTEKDPVHDVKPYNCQDHKENLEICQYDEDNITVFADGGYFIRDKKTGEYLSMFGSHHVPPSSNLSPQCSGRTRFLDNLKIRYFYSCKHYDRRLELDEKAREIALSLYRPNYQIEQKLDSGGTR